MKLVNVGDCTVLLTQCTLWLKVFGNTWPVAASQSSDVGKGMSANLLFRGAQYITREGHEGWGRWGVV